MKLLVVGGVVGGTVATAIIMKLPRAQCDDVFDKAFTAVVRECEDIFRGDLEAGGEPQRKKRRVLRRSGEAQYSNVYKFLREAAACASKRA